MTGRSTSDERVYPVREDSELLLPFARVPPGSRLLEIGCGQGFAALAAARVGARVVATDLNPWALRELRRVARRERLDVSPVRTDLARGLGRFDRILSNPPYLPTPPAARDPDPWVNLALDGGSDGLRVTRRLFAELPDHLRAGGAAYIVTSSRQEAARLARLRAGWDSAHGAIEAVTSRRIGDETLAVWRLPLGRNRPRRSGSVQ